MKVNEKGFYQCFGIIQGEHPILILKESALAEKLVKEAHILTNHGGMILTMDKVSSEYWIPSLRQPVKKTIKKCYGCKRFQVSRYPEPSMGLLPFKIISVDYVKTKQKWVKKLKYTFYYLRAVLPELYILNSCQISLQEFIMALKRSIAIRGRAPIIYSDNAKTFVAASNWIRKINKDEKMQEYLIKEQKQKKKKWKCNLSRAPSWGG